MERYMLNAAKQSMAYHKQVNYATMNWSLTSRLTVTTKPNTHMDCSDTKQET